MHLDQVFVLRNTHLGTTNQNPLQTPKCVFFKRFVTFFFLCKMTSSYNPYLSKQWQPVASNTVTVQEPKLSLHLCFYPPEQWKIIGIVLTVGEQAFPHSGFSLLGFKTTWATKHSLPSGWVFFFLNFPETQLLQLSD